jgi:hypothetical protein
MICNLATKLLSLLKLYTESIKATMFLSISLYAEVLFCKKCLSCRLMVAISATPSYHNAYHTDWWNNIHSVGCRNILDILSTPSFISIELSPWFVHKMHGAKVYLMHIKEMKKMQFVVWCNMQEPGLPWWPRKPQGIIYWFSMLIHVHFILQFCHKVFLYSTLYDWQWGSLDFTRLPGLIITLDLKCDKKMNLSNILAKFHWLA